MKIRVCSLLGMALTINLVGGSIAQAQMPQQGASGNSQVGMIFYPVENGPNGQYIVTRAGYRIAVPGLGIAPNASQIAVFQDPQSHYWYVDKNNNPTAVSPEQMQTVMSQMQSQAMQRGQAQYNQQPQYTAPAPAAAQAPQQQAAPQQSTSTNNGSSAMMTGVAAAGGAAVGSMITNSMYNNNNPYYNGNTPYYGHPIYKEPTGQYYYANENGYHVPVAPTANTQAAYNQYNQQQKYNDASQAVKTNAAYNQYGQQQKYNDVSQAAANNPGTRRGTESAASEPQGKRHRLRGGESEGDTSSRNLGNAGQQDASGGRGRRMEAGSAGGERLRQEGGRRVRR